MGQNLRMNTGIYEIVNAVNGNRYVGSAVNVSTRWRSHKAALRRGNHDNQYLQRSWNKYGADSFGFRLILLCAPKDLLLYEQRCIDGFSPEYNMAPTAGNLLGYKHTDEAKAKVSASKKGMKRPTFTIETRERMSIARRGKKHSPEHRYNNAAARRGKPLSAEHRAKLSAIGLGRMFTPEHSRRISEALRGRKFTPEHCANISAAKLSAKLNKEK